LRGTSSEACRSNAGHHDRTILDPYVMRRWRVTRRYRWINPVAQSSRVPADRRQRRAGQPRAAAAAFLKKAPAIGDGCQSREETLRNVSRFAGALCVAIHTCIRKLREPPGTKVRRGPEPAPFTVSAWRASWVERARRPVWFYRQMPGDRARRSVLFEASSVRRGSWQAYRASADLLPGDRRLLSEAPASQPARPSVMSRPWKSRTRQAIGWTAAALPRRTPISFAHSTHTQYPWIVVPRVLRANYDRQPGRIRFLICAATPMMPSKGRLEPGDRAVI